MPYEFTLPLTEEDVRQLHIGDVLYIRGTLYTCRDMGHRRLVNAIEKNEELPFDLSNGVLWHCGPIVQYENDQWQIISAGSTTSSRFSSLGAYLIDTFSIRLTIGKGTMDEEAHQAMQRVGSCYVNTVGGCAALYAEAITAVHGVHWLDLGQPEAVWELEVDGLGPLIVSIDAEGNSIYDRIKAQAQKRINELSSRKGLKKSYAYLPKRVLAGRGG